MEISCTFECVEGEGMSSCTVVLSEHLPVEILVVLLETSFFLSRASVKASD